MTGAQRAQHEGMKREARDMLCTLIGERVMHGLGKPANLCRLVVRPLWSDHYRVNIFAGEDSVAAKIVNSYFVRADDDGNILESRPRITKQY